MSQSFQYSVFYLLVANFKNADMLHKDGSIEVECHASCFFEDGSILKTWTCGDELPQEHSGCLCQGLSSYYSFVWLEGTILQGGIENFSVAHNDLLQRMTRVLQFS